MRPARQLQPDSDSGPFAFGLTEAEVERLRQILCRETGTDVTRSAAAARAIELLNLFRMLLGPITEDPNATEFEHPRR